MNKNRHVPILLFSLLLLGITLLGCGQLEELEQIKDTKATSGPTLFVDGDYNGDASNGTQEFPYKNIQMAINAAKTGQTIFIKSFADSMSCYKESLYINKRINLQGDGTTKIEIELPLSNPNYSEGMIVFDGPDACGTISGFELSHVTWNYGSGILCKNGAAPKIIGNRVWCQLYGVSVISGAHPYIENNTFIRNALGIRIDQGIIPTIIKNNRILDSYYAGLGVWGGVIVTSGSKATIVNNTICGGYTGVYLWGSTSANVNIYNNLICYNTQEGIYIQTKNEAAIFNNIIAYNTRGILNPSGSSLNIQYNSVANNTNSDISTSTGVSNTLNIVPDISISDEEYTVVNQCLFSDQGHPDNYFNDHDNSRNDIGTNGGNYVF